MENVMINWISRMQKLEDETPFTDEWWHECADALEMLPKEHREGFMDTFVYVAIAM